MGYPRAERAYLEAVKLEESGKYEEAAELYRFAAKRGHDGAQLNLGNILDDRLEPPQHAEARKWYRRAATRGYGPAAWNLALHYQKQGKQSLYLRWLQRAANLGDEDAEEALRLQQELDQ